ncbi:hypothetical protein GC197_08265 [bacterium]|nr:hypothetical protein [bacterium]
MAAIKRLPIVGVMGSGQDVWSELSQPLGKLIARYDVHLLTGGGQGTMAAVSQAYAESPGRTGQVIGVLPSDSSGEHTKPGYPNDWVEIAIATHLAHSGKEGTNPLSRNHINILSADVIVALPGSLGTASEIQLALHYGKPWIAYLGTDGKIEGLDDDANRATTLDQVEAFLTAKLGFVPSR